MRSLRPFIVIAALIAAVPLGLPACAYRDAKPANEPSSSSEGRLGNLLQPDINGHAVNLKTTDVDGGTLLNVAVATLPADASITGTFSATGPGASGAARSGNPVVVAGSDGTNAVDLKVDTSGNLRNKPVNTSGSIMTGVTSASDQTSSAVDVRGYANVCVWITMANTSTPVGAFSILGSADNTNFNTVHLAADGVIGANFTGAYTSSTGYAGGYSVAVSSPSGTVVVQACITNTTPYFKVFWDNTSGGAVTTINAGYFAYN